MRPLTFALAGLWLVAFATPSLAQSRSDTATVLRAMLPEELYDRVTPGEPGRLVPLVLDAALEPWRPFIQERLGLLCMRGTPDSTYGVSAVNVFLSMDSLGAELLTETLILSPPGAGGYGLTQHFRRGPDGALTAEGIGASISDGEFLPPPGPRPAYPACTGSPAS